MLSVEQNSKARVAMRPPRAGRETRLSGSTGWQPVATAPFDRDLELAVISGDEVHALVFACRRAFHGWIDAETEEPIDVEPTHWRTWTDA